MSEITDALQESAGNGGKRRINSLAALFVAIASGMSLLGIVLGVAAFLKVSLHSDLVSRILG